MIKGLIFDLDGTVYRGKAEVPGAALFLAWAKEQGLKCVFVTNRANRTPDDILVQLRGHGIACELDDILTSAQVTAAYLKKGSVFFIGEEGLGRELRKAGFVITDKAPDYVIISFDTNLTDEKIDKASLLVKQGAKLVATNPDRSLPTESGMRPGTGAIMEAVVARTGAKPLVIGKPEKMILEFAMKRLGLKKAEILNVGDNLETDVPAGENFGVRTVLMLTGYSKREDIEKFQVRPTWVCENYEQLADIIKAQDSGVAADRNP